MKLSGHIILEKIRNLLRHPVDGVVLKRTSCWKESGKPTPAYTRIEDCHVHKLFEIDDCEILVVVNLGSAREVLVDWIKEGTEKDSDTEFIDLRLQGRKWHLVSGKKKGVLNLE